MYIQRHIQSVVERMAKRKPVIILTGPRQVGKSTMLKGLYDRLLEVVLDSTGLYMVMEYEDCLKKSIRQNF